MKIENAQITIQIDDPIYMGELAEYLQLLNAFYDAFRFDLYAVTQGEDVDLDDQRLEPFRNPLKQNDDTRARWAQNALRFMAFPPLRRPEEALAIDRIKYECPLIIAVTCILPCLAAAAIISGGEVNIMGIKFILKPLGEGIRALRDALIPAHSPYPPLPRRPHPH